MPSVIPLQAWALLKLQFSLALLLFLVVPAAWLALFVRDFQMAAPIAFEPFTWARMEQCVDDDQTVLLYCHPNYAVPDDYVPQELSDNRLRRSFHEGNFLAMKLEYDDWSGDDIKNVFRAVGHTKYMMLILFLPEHTPERIDNVDVDQWFDNRIELPAEKRYRWVLGIASALIGLACLPKIVNSRRKNTG